MADYFAPMNNALARLAMGMQYQNQQQRQGRLDEASERRNALAEKLTMAQIAQMEQDQQRQLQLDRALSGMFNQRVPGTGPMRDVSTYQPGRMEKTVPTYDRALSALAPFGKEGIALAQSFKGDDVNPYEGLDRGYETFLRANQIPNSPQAYKAYQDNVLAQKRAGATNVSQTVGGESGPQFGTIPSGMMLEKTPEGGYVMKPVPGSPEERERLELETKNRKKATEAIAKSKIVTSTIDKAINQAGVFTTGFLGNLLKDVAGSPAFDLNKNIETVQANVGFDTLQKMREASPTGGALGAVSERELTLLESALGALAQAQSRDQFVENLMAVRNHYNNWKSAVEEAYRQPASWKDKRGGSIEFLGWE